MDYGFHVDEEVCHIKDPSLRGFVTEIDSAHDLGGVTTCRVVWHVKSADEARATPIADQDIQWTNKLCRV